MENNKQNQTVSINNRKRKYPFLEQYVHFNNVNDMNEWLRIFKPFVNIIFRNQVAGGTETDYYIDYIIGFTTNFRVDEDGMKTLAKILNNDLCCSM